MSEHFSEEMHLRGEQVMQKIKELIHQGNVRAITIKDKEGRSIVSLPLTIGVIGAVLSPTLAAIGAIAALVKECTITVEFKGQAV